MSIAETRRQTDNGSCDFVAEALASLKWMLESHGPYLELSSPMTLGFETPPGRLAGIDFGTVRVGIALTDARRTLASPHSIYRRGDQAADAMFFRCLAADERIAAFIVGLPVHLDGRESQKSIEARDFGKWLAEATNLPVTFFDERFTTSEADQFLGAARLTKKRRKNRRDMLAAQIMLASYLESNTRGDSRPLALDD